MPSKQGHQGIRLDGFKTRICIAENETMLENEHPEQGSVESVRLDYSVLVGFYACSRLKPRLT
jgi:hypothetical protein